MHTAGERRHPHRPPYQGVPRPGRVLRRRRPHEPGRNNEARRDPRPRPVRSGAGGVHPRQHHRERGAAGRRGRPARRQELAGTTGPDGPRDGGVRRSGLQGPAHVGDKQRGAGQDIHLLRDEDRADLLPPTHHARGEPVRQRDSGQQVPGTARADPEPAPSRLRVERPPGPVVRRRDDRAPQVAGTERIRGQRRKAGPRGWRGAEDG